MIGEFRGFRTFFPFTRLISQRYLYGQSGVLSDDHRLWKMVADGADGSFSHME